MANDKKIRLNSVARSLNVGQLTVVDFLKSKGFAVENSPSFMLDNTMHEALEKEFSSSKKPVVVKTKPLIKNESVSLKPEVKVELAPKAEVKSEPKIEVKAEVKSEIKPTTEPIVPAVAENKGGVKILGSIDLSAFDKKPKPKTNHKSANQGNDKKPARTDAPAKQVAVKNADSETKKPQAKPVVKLVEKPVQKAVEKPVEKIDIVRTTKTFDQRMAEEGSQDLFRAGSEGNKPAGPKVLGTIDLTQFEKKKSEPSAHDKNKNKRKRIKKDNKVDVNNPKNHNTAGNKPGQKPGAPRPDGAGGQNRPNNAGGPGANRPGGNRPNTGGARPNSGGFKKGNNTRPAPAGAKPEVTDEQVQKQIKETLARLTAKTKKSKSSVHRKDKREAFNAKLSHDIEKQQLEKQTIQVTEFVTVSELAKMMDVDVTQVITACMNLGLMVSINQRLDAEALVVVAEEFDFKVEFVSVDIQESISSEEDREEDMISRPPIVTVMGHVDHGKTSLLDFIRKANVIAGEAGGITQHIGAYNVKMDNGSRITFLDTPGHEAFTAMRARGASVTDVAIIIIAADDSIMPQTIEAINHASAAGVPIIFAINKIDKDGANPEKIREKLSSMNYLVEDWGGKYQCQEISAKSGENVNLLLEKVVLEAEMLELKANPDRRAEGVVIESTLDKGRGYVTTVLVEKGTLKVGDTMLSGIYTGKVKAMYNERGVKIKTAGPSSPVLVLGLNGASQAGDKFNIMDNDKQARDIANKREQLQRIQGLRTQRHITLDDIGKRIAIGNFQELNVIIKGDVDGSVEALTDSLIKESQEQVQVRIIHKAVGQISESDVLLAAASNALIIGFQVRPSANARRLADKEEIEIRHYSIIYDAINDIKSAIKGMLAPVYKENITCSVEVMETFKITKVGTVAGCIVREGKINRNSSIRIIRDGVVGYTGKLGSLKRYKDDAKEVVVGLECGLNIENYNDIKVGDVIEGYEQIEIKQ